MRIIDWNYSTSVVGFWTIHELAFSTEPKDVFY